MRILAYTQEVDMKKPSTKDRRQRAAQRRWWDAHIASLPKRRRRRASRIAARACA